MIIDLSHPLQSGMPVYPGDRPVTVEVQETFGDRGFNVRVITMNGHAGTHVDAPYHRRPDGMTVDDPRVLDACVGEALVVQVPDAGPEHEINADDLGGVADRIGAGGRLLIATGWDTRFGGDDYFTAHPGISRELAVMLAGRKLRLVGIDTPSVHAAQSPEIHDILLGAGIVVVEGLANLGRIGNGTVQFSAAPLHLAGFDGSPVRAYAVVPE